MNAQKSTLFGQRRESKKREGGLSYAEFLNLYGGLLDDLEPLVLELSKAGITLGSGHPRDVESEVNAEFAARVAALQQKIKDTVEKQHMGGFDGNVKRVVADTYGPDSDIAMKYGDQEENALCLILPGQAKKVSAIKLVAEFLGVTTPPATPKAVKPMLEAARVKINVAEEERKKSHETTTRPTKREDETRSEYLKRVHTYNAAGKGASSEFGEVKGAVSWLTNWIEGRKPTTKAGDQQSAPEPPKDRKTKLKETIHELEERLTELNTQVQNALASNNRPAARAAMESAEGIESELTAARAELKTVEVGERENTRLKAAATVVATASPKPGEVTGTIGNIKVVDAKSAIEDIKPDTLEEVVALITRLEKEYTDTTAAADRHYAEATALYEEAEKDRAAGKRGIAGKKYVDGSDLEAKGAKTKNAAEKVRLRVAALLNKKAELEAAKTPATPPAAEAKPKKKVRLAGRKPAVVEPVVAASGAVTPDGSTQTIDKLALIKAIKAKKDELGDETVKNLLAMISGGDTATAKEMFEAMTN